MSKKKKAKKTVGALGENLKTNKPEVSLNYIPKTEPAKKPEPKKKVIKPKEKPESWPFNRSKVANEKAELAHISRLINMKFDNPGAKTITKVVVYDCWNRTVKCKDYKIKY